MPCVHWTVVQPEERGMDHYSGNGLDLVDHGPIQTGAGLQHATVAVIGRTSMGAVRSWLLAKLVD
jgi:hypothetical protein